MNQTYRIEDRQGDVVIWEDDFPNLYAARMFFRSFIHEMGDYRPHAARRLVLLAVEPYPGKHRREETTP